MIESVSRAVVREASAIFNSRSSAVKVGMSLQHFRRHLVGGAADKFHQRNAQRDGGFFPGGFLGRRHEQRPDLFAARRDGPLLSRAAAVRAAPAEFLARRTGYHLGVASRTAFDVSHISIVALDYSVGKH